MRLPDWQFPLWGYRKSAASIASCWFRLVVKSPDSFGSLHRSNIRVFVAPSRAWVGITACFFWWATLKPHYATFSSSSDWFILPCSDNYVVHFLFSQHVFHDDQHNEMKCEIIDKKTPTYFNISFPNVRGIRSNFSSIESFPLDRWFYILALCETILNSGIATN